MQQHSLGGPSFHPLYESQRSRKFPETPTWATGDDAPAWTDVLIDLRLPHSRAALPDDLGDPEHTWESNAPGWSMSGWSLFSVEDYLTRLMLVNQDGTEMAGLGETPDAVSLVRITDPDGFSFALVVSHDKDNEQRPKFNGGRLAFVMPTMRVLFSNCMGHEDSAILSLDTFANASMTYSLPVLRDAVRDPAAWFGTDGTEVDWQSLDIETTFSPVNPTRALLAWAAGGASSYAEAADWVQGGMDPAEVAGWKDHIATYDLPADDETGPAGDDAKNVEPWTDAEIRAWFAVFGGGNRHRKPAIRYRQGGLTVDQAFRWRYLLESSNTAGPLRVWIDRFEATGWTSEHINEMKTSLRNHHTKANPDQWPPPHSGIPEVGAWAFMSPDRALAYLAAGFAPDEVMTMEQAGEPVDLHTLTVMAGLLAPVVEPAPYW